MLHVYNVHLGTAVLERRYQAKRLASFVHDRRVTGPKMILGDFNEWMKGLATKTLSSLFESVDISQHLKRRRTYPGLFPVVHLDHIYYEGRVEVHERRDAAHAQVADGVGSPAAGREPPDRVDAGSMSEVRARHLGAISVRLTPTACRPIATDVDGIHARASRLRLPAVVRDGVEGSSVTVVLDRKIAGMSADDSRRRRAALRLP